MQNDLASCHLILYAPELFAARVSPAPSEGAAARLDNLVQTFLWPMARERIVHPVMNRVRQHAGAPVLPFRFLIRPLHPQRLNLGFVAALRTHDQEPFTNADLATLTAAVPDLNRALTSRLDPTTGLLLRPAFETEVALRSRGTDTACVVYANLDQVHVVNEMSGFAAGDRIIREVAGCWLQRLAPSGGIATHLSGDRFAAVLFGHTLNQARTWADDTREAIQHIDERRLDTRVTASLGVAVLADAESFQHALAAAETACRVAKDRGRNRVELYVTGDHTRHAPPRTSARIPGSA